MKDELKKLGLQVRPRPTPNARAEKPGKIAFDDRGNAIFEWADDRLGEDSDLGEQLRGRALAHPGLSIVEEEAPATAPIRNNPKGLRLGYNPYESGMLAKKQRRKKVDLEQLSKMIELKRRLKDRPPE